MIKFEKVKRFQDDDSFNLPVRKTAGSAGYDFEVAEDIIIPPYRACIDKMKEFQHKLPSQPGLKDIARWTSSTARPTLVPTGVKCYMDPGYYLELTVRSSTPLKYWLICANSEGIVDADYYSNPDNDGEIFFQVINLSPSKIYLKKGDIIGQGIIKKYVTIDDDDTTAERTGGFGSTTLEGENK